MNEERVATTVPQAINSHTGGNSATVDTTIRTRVQMKTDGTRPAWARDGSELFYVDSRQHMMAVRVRSDQPTFVSESAVELFDASDYAMAIGPRPGRTYEVDGDGFLLLKQVEAAEGSGRRQILVQNWFEELKRLVPAN